MGYGGLEPELLANETLMREGQVIRSTTNQVYIHYRSLQQTNHGMFSLHYQGKLTFRFHEITKNVWEMFSHAIWIYVFF